MANQGMYREGGVAVPGLPFPRTRLMPLTIVIGIVALLAIVVSLAMFVGVGGGMAGAWRLFRNGGWPMWFILLSDFLAPILIGVFAVFVVRGKQTPAGLLFACAAIPFTLALFGAWIGQSMVIGAISGESVDPEQKARILAEGFSEAMSADIFGGLVACGAGIVASIAAASAAASIDTALAARDTKPSSLGTIGAGASGVLWIVATLAVGGLRVKDAGLTVLLPVLPLLVIVPFAVMAGRGAAVVKGWHDPKEGSRVAGAIVVAGASAALALLALQRCVEATYASKALGAISGESVDPSQRLRILVYAVDAGRLAPVSYAVHAVLGAATFGLALAPSLGNGKHPATPSAIVAVVIGLFLVGGTFVIGSKRASVPHQFAESARASKPGGVELPSMVEALSDKRSGGAYGTRVVVAKDGGGEPPASATSTSSGFTIYADKAATLGMVRARLDADTSRGLRVTFVATREQPADLVKKIGYLADYLGNTGYVSATMQDEPPFSSSSETLRIVSVADDAIEIEGKRYSLPLSETGETGTGATKRYVHYTFRPSDPIGRVVSVISGVEKLLRHQIVTYDFSRWIVIDDPSRPKKTAEVGGIGLGTFGTLPNGSGIGLGASRVPSVRQGATTVNGRLPPEVIQRIVRQNFGRFRLCYENGLRNDPKLAGRVTVKFVIDRSGAVSSAADGGSELTDKGVIACVVRGFSNMNFPQPEGGIVTVVYPLIFNPGN